MVNINIKIVSLFGVKCFLTFLVQFWGFKRNKLPNLTILDLENMTLDDFVFGRMPLKRKMFVINFLVHF